MWNGVEGVEDGLLNVGRDGGNAQPCRGLHCGAAHSVVCPPVTSLSELLRQERERLPQQTYFSDLGVGTVAIESPRTTA